MPTLAAIEMFACIARNASFTKAALELNASRAMASKHVKDLEDELGVRLFDRTTRKIRLTEAGSNYLVHAEDAIASLDKGLKAAEKFGDRPQGQLRITAPPSFASEFLFSVIAAFQNLYPKLQLDVQFDGRYSDLIEDAFDIALRVSDPKDSSLIARKFFDVPYTCCASPGYLQKHGEPLQPKDLSKHHCLNYTHKLDGLTWQFHPVDKSEPLQRVKVRDTFTSNEANLLIHLAKADAGVIYAPKFKVKGELASGELVSVINTHYPTPLSLYAFYAPGRHPPEKLRRFIDHLDELFRGDL